MHARGNEVRAAGRNPDPRAGAAPSTKMNAWAWHVPIGGRVRQSTEFARTFRLPRLTLLSTDIVSRHPREVRGTEGKIRRRQDLMSVYKSRTARISIP